MTDGIAYEKPDGTFVDADAARWVMGILDVLEAARPGFRDAVIAWIEASELRTAPAPPEVLQALRIAGRIPRTE